MLGQKEDVDVITEDWKKFVMDLQLPKLGKITGDRFDSTDTAFRIDKPKTWKWNENDVRRVIDTIRKSGVKRALFVVGAGSLLRKDGKRHYDYMSEKGVQPPTSLPALQAYEEIQKIEDLDWTAISPPASIPAGQRTGKFRRGLDKLIENSKGESRISREDFAIAIVDEIEKPKHTRKRFTVGY